jgi:crotonobetainyl-CoA:carnitine CoA-transferase CaiB-like acyl-CoA transferase
VTITKDAFYADARRDLPGPLAGVRVLEATTMWAGPLCGCVFADFGADVIKVEVPGGEVVRRLPPMLAGTDPPVGFMQATVNRNKRSLTLDLRKPEGRAVFLKLAERADVLVENFRPGVMDRYGLGYADVRAVRPSIVYVSISGFGQWGPDADRAGYDPLAQAASGWLALNGEPAGQAVKAPTFLADDLAGLHAALGALAALRHRDQTGEGQHVDVALLDAMLFQSNGYLTLGALGDALPRLGNEFRIAAPARVYASRDGDVLVGVVLDAHWRSLTALIGKPELGADPRYATTPGRLAHRAEVDALVADWVAAHTTREVVDALCVAGLAVSPVRSYAEAAADPHVRARDMLEPVEQEDGTSVPITGPAAKLSRTPLRIRSGAPALGRHSDEILREAGLDDAAIAALRAKGVV